MTVSKQPELHFKFLLKSEKFTWFSAAEAVPVITKAPEGNTVSKPSTQMMVNTLTGDDYPIVGKVVCWMLSGGVSVFSGEYKEGGIMVDYDVKPTIDAINTEADPLGLYPDTLKIAFFSKLPQFSKDNQKNNPEFINTYVGNDNLYGLVCSGFLDVRALRNAMVDDKEGIISEFAHNFTGHKLTFSICKAELSMNGVHHTSKQTWMSEGNLNTVFYRSMLHDMHSRSEVLVANMQMYGKAVSSLATERPNSIGSLYKCPITCGNMMNDVMRVADMGAYMKADKGAICPQRVSHQIMHAFALNGIQPHLPGVVIKDNILGFRELKQNEIVDMLHTAITFPVYSNTLQPYVSDVTLKPSINSMKMMALGGTIFKWDACDFSATENIDTRFTYPNDGLRSGMRATDCESGFATYAATMHDLEACHTKPLEAIREFASSGDLQALKSWASEYCHAELPDEQLLACATQIVMLGAVAQTSVKLHATTIGAQSATPLQKTQHDLVLTEQGHSAGMLRVNTKQMLSTAHNVYSHVKQLFSTDPSTCKLQIHLLSTELPLLSSLTDQATYNTLFKMHQTPDKNSQLFDLANLEYRLLESTTTVSGARLHEESVLNNGTLSVSAAPGSKEMYAGLREVLGKKGSYDVTLAEYLTLRNMHLVDSYLRDFSQVRVTGFVTEKPVKDTAQFYHTFYMLDDYAINQIETDVSNSKSYMIGANASDFLYRRNESQMTIEKTGYPLLSTSNAETLQAALQKQWAESRLPSIGSEAAEAPVKFWEKALPVEAHCPQTSEHLRVTVSVAGPQGDKLWREFCKDNKLEKELSADPSVLDSKVIRMANTTVIAQTLDLKHISLNGGAFGVACKK